MSSIAPYLKFNQLELKEDLQMCRELCSQLIDSDLFPIDTIALRLHLPEQILLNWIKHTGQQPIVINDIIDSTDSSSLSSDSRTPYLSRQSLHELLTHIHVELQNIQQNKDKHQSEKVQKASNLLHQFTTISIKHNSSIPSISSSNKSPIPSSCLRFSEIELDELSMSRILLKQIYESNIFQSEPLITRLNLTDELFQAWINNSNEQQPKLINDLYEHSALASIISLYPSLDKQLLGIGRLREVLITIRGQLQTMVDNLLGDAECSYKSLISFGCGSLLLFIQAWNKSSVRFKRVIKGSDWNIFDSYICFNNIRDIESSSNSISLNLRHDEGIGDLLEDDIDGMALLCLIDIVVN